MNLLKPLRAAWVANHRAAKEKYGRKIHALFFLHDSARHTY
jgi:hypothetical protein